MKSNFTDEWAETREPTLPSEETISEILIKSIQASNLQVL